MTKLDKNTNILIVGLGVIGGGYARALTEKGYSVSCITKNPEDVEYALREGIIKRGTHKIDADLIKDSHLIIFALYPNVFIKWVEDYQHLFSKGTVITDVTGVKSGIVDRVQSILRPDVEFISAHPMAGREKKRSGIQQRRGIQRSKLHRCSNREKYEGSNRDL